MKFNFKKGAATMLTALVATGAMVAPTFAEEGKVYTAVNGGEISFEKYLVMDDEASVPNVTFNYTIASGVAQEANATNKTAQVRAGDAADQITVGSAVFAVGDATYTEAQSLTAGGLETTVDQKDNVTLKDGQKYAKKSVSIDLSKVSFTEPGVYRYIVSETASNAAGITNDSDATRVLDVYVEDDNGALKVAGYVLHNGADDSTVNVDGTGTTAKAEGYINTYTTADLTISKSVEGNQASTDKYSKISVDFDGDIPDGTVYKVDLTNADPTTKETKDDEAHTNPSAIRKTATGWETGSVDENGNFVSDGKDPSSEVDFYIQNGQSITIQGLADGTSYTVKEDTDSLEKQGYSVSSEVTGDKDGVTGEGSGTISDTGLGGDTTIAFKETKSGVIPTGLINSVGLAGATTAIALLGVGTYIFVSKKKEDEE